MSNSDDTIRKLDKAFEGKVDTSSAREAWQERFERRTSVASSKSQIAADVISNRGLGSWAASITRSDSFKLGGSAATVEYPGDSRVPTGRTSSFSKLGQKGLPEINFVPYHWRTHATGTKGPSLLGHPISFSVAGPTLKSPYCDWQWKVVDNSGVPGVGDTLQMVNGPFGSMSATSIDQAYEKATLKNGGAYLVISMTGEFGGLNLPLPSDGPLQFRADYGDRALFEIFRIDSVGPSDTLVLDPNKRLADYFFFSGAYTDWYVRAITVIYPEVTRLVAVPGSGPSQGLEQVYAIVPPEKSLNSDLYPPYETWFTTWGAEKDVWSGHVSLPVPIPVPLSYGYTEFEGVVEPNSAAPPNSAIGLWRIHNIDPQGAATPVNMFQASDVGQIIEVYSVQREDPTTTEDTQFNRDLKSVLGWYEIYDYGYAAGTFDNYLVLKRIAEVNPETGEIFYGPGPYGINTDTATVQFRSYNPIDNLWMSTLPDLDAIDASRLTNLIDPEWVAETIKVKQDVPGKVRPSLPDRAIFNTRITASGAENPGSLLDLGFRMVLFPGKQFGGSIVPDFDKPIDSRNVVIDPTITDEEQYLDIDYSAGIVRLSHAPVPYPSSASDIRPNALVGSNNPRNEVVLFAACVPYSMEEGQTGPGVRIRGGSHPSRLTGTIDQEVLRDVYSSQVWLDIKPSQNPTLPGDYLAVTLDTDNVFPESGHADILISSTTKDGYTYSTGTVGWFRKGIVNLGGVNYTSLEGIHKTANYGAPNIVIPAGGGIAVLRRDVEADFVLDTAYGAAARAASINLAYGDVTFNADGSVTLLPTAVAGPAEELRAFYPLGIPTKKSGAPTEVGRLYLDPTTQQWSFTGPPWQSSPADYDVGLDISRGKVFSSMSIDTQTTLKYQWWLNRSYQVTRSVNEISSRWTLDVDTGAFPTPLPNGVMDTIPDWTEVLSQSDNVCASLEGTTIASADITNWFGAPLDVGHRFICNVKKFLGRSSRDSNAYEMKAIDEGPSNPLDWFVYTGTGADTPTSMAAAINGFYSTRGANPASDYADRLWLTERQVSILPQKPYLESDPWGAPFFVSNMRYFLTVYSADPRQTTAKRWCSIEVNPDNFVGPAVDSASAAAILNQPLYDPAHINYIGNILNDAGFMPNSNPGITSNPYLLGIGVSERQFLWIGNDDPRHPTGADTVCLICGGYGVCDSQNTPFYNVMIEIATTDGSAVVDVYKLLGGDFTPASSRTVARCGLFYGPSADDTLTTLATPATILADFIANKEATEANANWDLGFDSFGVDPLGFLCGSWPIEAATATSIDVKLPTGTTDFYEGPRTPTVATGDMWMQAYRYPKDGLGYPRESATEQPYLGRWVWGQRDRQTIDLGDSADAGLAHIWVSYTHETHDETGFENYLTAVGIDNERGRNGYLLYGYTVDDELDPPKLSQSGLSKGDLLLCADYASPRTGEEVSWRGVILDTSVTQPPFVATTPTYSIAAMVRPGGFPDTTRTRDHVLATSIQPGEFTDLYQIIDGSVSIGQVFSTSIVPNPSAITLSSAFRSLYPHLMGPSTFAKNPGLNVIGPDDGSGLDGGYSTNVETGIANAVVMGGGRIEMVNMIGPDLPAGLGFSSPVVGSENTGIRFANTFLEHGVFTTSVSLGSKAIESAGLFDAYRDSERSTVGRVHGQSVGGSYGLRVSGDAQVWLTNLRALRSEKTTAVVRARSTRSAGSVFPANTIGTGPVTMVGEDQGLVPRTFLTLGELGGDTLGSMAHIPSGYGPAYRRTALADYVHQEATVSIALTRADVRGFMAATTKLAAPDQVYNTAGGAFSYLLGQSARIGDCPIPVGFLQGCFLDLGPGVFFSPSGNEPANEGTWRVIGAPMITSSAIADLIGPSSVATRDIYEFSPYSSLRTTFGFPTIPIGSATDLGHSPASAIVAYLQVRVERLARVHNPPVGNATETFYPETVTTFTDGHPWGFYEDEGATYPIYVADVIDPGGSPTGSPSNLSGLTLNPWALGGRPSCPMDLVSVFSQTAAQTQSWPLVGRSKLYGIHESMDHRGRKISHAYFSMEESGTPTTNLPRNACARAVIYSSHREDRLDDVAMANTRGEFSVDAAGRVSFVGHPSRMGLGVILDGGLGTVQATAFRSTPKAETSDTIGSLAIWGQKAAHPLPSFATERANVAGISLPSTFNKAEFHEDVVVVGPRSKILFESSRSAMGLSYNLRAIVAASDADYNPAQLAYLRAGEQYVHTLDEDSTLRVTPNDTLFPFSCVGMKFKTPGGLIYERPFRPTDATGQNIYRSSFSGRASEGGIKGIEVPTSGECLLLPKGPATIHGHGITCWSNTSYGDGTARGNTPTDLPLYEFTNGHGQEALMTPYFPINPGPIFTEGVGGSSQPGGLHSVNPGSVHAGYRHSSSIEDGTVYGYWGAQTSVFDVVEQMRLLPGMILEDVDNGTFYNVGDVGRIKDYQAGVGTPSYVTVNLSQPADSATRPAVVGDMTVSAGRHEMQNITFNGPIAGDTVTITIQDKGPTVFTAVAGPPTPPQFQIGATDADTADNFAATVSAWYMAGGYRPISYSASGSAVAWIVGSSPQNKAPSAGLGVPLLSVSTSSALRIPLSIGLYGSEPEICFDLGPHTDPLTDIGTMSNGYGDRVDSGWVRRPLAGHRFRVHANVEMVPVLGPRGVDGGLLPPLDPTDPTQYIEGADAVFYSLSYPFQSTVASPGGGDIGRFIYLCGTYEYAYTGWWLIIDVIDNYPFENGGITTDGSVAVLRKWNRGEETKAAVEDVSTPGHVYLSQGFPMQKYRAPILRMCADVRSNDAPWTTGLFNAQTPTNYSDLTLEVTDSNGNNLWAVTVPAATLAGAGVTNCVIFAAYANANTNLNGANVPGFPANWIVWSVEANAQFEYGVTVMVTYDVSILSAAQQAQVLGEKATLRVTFFSTGALTTAPFIAPAVNHTFSDSNLAVGFYSFQGHNQAIDRCAGDRNNAAMIKSPSPLLPNSFSDYLAYSAAQGLRWVFSSPLTEEHVGSFLHLSQPRMYRFGYQLPSQNDLADGGVAPNYRLWCSGFPREPDTVVPVIDSRNDIYRINRCPNTSQLVLGGDCEVYWPEIILTGGVGFYGGQVKGTPIMYSPLGVSGVWPDTISGELPATGSINKPTYYALQPIAREKIVTVSPRYGRSSPILVRGETEGARGVSGMVVGNEPTAASLDVTSSFGLEHPWKLVDRYAVMRTRLAPTRIIGAGWIANDYGPLYSDEVEMNNANNVFPDDSTYPLAPIPDSSYVWAPAGEWWQLYWPAAYQESNQYDASFPPPILKIDLTETFTQAMQAGGGINSPYRDHTPRGVRLTKIWVNCGLWGNEVGAAALEDAWPGYNVGLTDNEPWRQFWMAFNLVVEIPGSQAANRNANNHPLGTGTAGFPFGDRAPTAIYNHDPNTEEAFPGGTIIVPLYCNREAGDLMPNVMERWVTGGPASVYNSFNLSLPDPSADWTIGDYEFGFGNGNVIGDEPYHNDSRYLSSSFNPMLWGGADFYNNAQFGAPAWVFDRRASKVLGVMQARQSRVSGGVRAPFTNGMFPNGYIFRDFPNQGLTAPGVTGIVLAHAASAPWPSTAEGGTLNSSWIPGNERHHSPATAGHAFTIGLTPVGDRFDPPTSAVQPEAVSAPKATHYGRELTSFEDPFTPSPTEGMPQSPALRTFKVGNWLDLICGAYGIATQSGSMLPPGARVYLEISTSPGPAAKLKYGSFPSEPSDASASGTWVGSVKVSFEVETADGVAYSMNVNALGHDE